MGVPRGRALWHSNVPSPSSRPPSPQGLVEQSPWLQEQLSQLLVSHGDPVTAARCAMGLSLPKERLPAAVAVELRQLSLQGR